MSELFPSASVRSSRLNRFPELDYSVYLADCAKRWDGDALRNARGNWHHWQEQRAVLNAAMLAFKAQSDKGLTAFLWDYQPVIQPDNTRLDPLLDFCEHHQKVHLRRGLVAYCTQILRALDAVSVGGALFGVGGPPHKVRQILSDECVRCSVASLFGMERENVPHFLIEGNGSWSVPFSDWLASHGLRMQPLHHTITPEAEWYLGYGPSTPTSAHMVVMRNGEVWHDPLGCGVTAWETWIVILPK